MKRTVKIVKALNMHRCPTGKRTYATDEIASGVLRTTMLLFGTQGLHIYRCEHCGHYHIGHE